MPQDLSYWPEFYTAPGVTIDRHPIIQPNAPLFTMGSCFAEEIRKAFQTLGYRMLPDYASVAFDHNRVKFDLVPVQRDFIAHYDTFVMRQEFEAAFGLWPDRPAGRFEIKDQRINEVMKSPVLYQDPYRKNVFSKEVELLEKLGADVTAKIKDGIAESPVLIITLGLIEVWQHNLTKRYLCRPPGSAGGGGVGLSTFRISTFKENYDNVRAILDMTFERFPDKKVILTVSPVPLERTYSGRDIGTANTESKSVLRAVAGQICREYSDRVFYFPSYDIATACRQANVFEADGRHVTREFAARIVELFLTFYRA